MIIKDDVTGPVAFEYITHQLEMGGKVFSTLLNSIRLLEGKVYSFIPEDALNKPKLNFDEGGLYKHRTMYTNVSSALIPVRNDSRKLVINIIEQHLSANKENCCLFEEPNAYYSDKTKYGNRNIEYVHLDEEVYYFFNRSNKESNSINKAFKISEGYYFVCVLSTLQEDKHHAFEAFKSITKNDLKEVADRATSLFVKAFDGESYLMWTMATVT